MEKLGEHIKTWRRAGFRLELYNTGKFDPLYHKHRLAYRFFDGKEMIFTGSDFYPSPMFAIDSLDCVYSLLGFLSLQTGDTDSEYFEQYTPRQMEWMQSGRAEELSYLIPDGM